MNKLEQAARQALEALIEANVVSERYQNAEKREQAITALREALDHSTDTGNMVECRHCGFLCKPNTDESRKWYPLAEQDVKESLTTEQPVSQEPVHEALQIASVALHDISCSSQTDNLLWWQTRAREAQKQIAECLTNAAPVQQDPVAYGFRSRDSVIIDCEILPDDYYSVPLYDHPVRTKELTKQEILKAQSTVFPDENYWENCARAVIAADREKNK